MSLMSEQGCGVGQLTILLWKETGSPQLTSSNLTVSVLVPCELRTADDLTDSLPGEVVDYYIRHGAHFVFVLSLGLAYSGLNKETSWKKPENRGYLRGMGASWSTAGVRRWRGSLQRAPAEWCWSRKSSWRTEARWVDSPPFYSWLIMLYKSTISLLLFP